MNFPILSSLILFPTIGALFIFFTKSSEKNKKRAPIVGSKIRDDKIGKFIILQLKKLIKQKNQAALQKHTDI